MIKFDMTHKCDFFASGGIHVDNRTIWQIALQQSAIDLNCKPEDFFGNENRVVVSEPHPQAKKYYRLPHVCQMVSYGSCVVASVRADAKETVDMYLKKVPASHAFETPNLHELDAMLLPHGLKSRFMGACFLPDTALLQPLPCAYELKLLHQEDFAELYLPQWSNALCEDRKQLDVLGVGAYDGEKLAGFAACSADGVEMWQIGVDVLPAYRRQGIAAALTSRLALEILERDKVPFYSAAWCNVASVRNAVKCGFRPAWVELSAGEIAGE